MAEMFEIGGQRKELKGLWLTPIALFVNLAILHFVIDETIIGPAGLMVCALICSLVFVVPDNQGKGLGFGIYMTLSLITVAAVWYMASEFGIMSPAAMVTFIIPGIALFFLGFFHFWIWLGIIISIYTYMAFWFDASVIPQNWPMPEVKIRHYKSDYWAMSLIMLNACAFIFYFLMKFNTALKEQAVIDPLTKAYNRRGFNDMMAQEFALFKRYSDTFSLLMIDADHFKQINDKHGHDAGDEVLIRLVEIIRNELRESDIVGRWGGEEFIALLPQTDTKKAQDVAERIRSAVEKSSVSVEGQPTAISFTVSMGLTDVKKDDSQIEDIIKKADEALYEAKENGRNRVVTG